LGIAITKMSANGQVVIPAEVRAEAHLKASEKFLVVFTGSELVLKPLREKEFLKEQELLKKIKLAEKQVSEGKKRIISAKQSSKEIDALLMK